MRSVVTTAPTIEPLDLEDAKTMLRVQFTIHDSLISGLIKSARSFFENETGWALMNRTLTTYLRFYPKNTVIRLPHPPLSSVTSIYTNVAGTPTEFTAAGNWYADTTSRPGGISLLPGKAWPTGVLHDPAVTIIHVAGFGTKTSSLPEDAIHAIRALVESWYNYPGGIYYPDDKRAGEPSVVPLTVSDTIARYKEAIK
jgi:uncharacterized phiE125 gp8 family phage protein